MKYLMVLAVVSSSFAAGFLWGRPAPRSHIENCYDVHVQSHMEGVQCGLRMCRDFIDRHKTDAGYSFSSGELVR